MIEIAASKSNETVAQILERIGIITTDYKSEQLSYWTYNGRTTPRPRTAEEFEKHLQRDFDIKIIWI
jgi:hypothetical protein